MKRILVIVVLALFVGGGALFAQTSPDFAQIQNDFKAFASDVSTSLPYASTMGLNWSTAYIGQLLHLGAGLAVGAVTIPTGGIDKVATDFGLPTVSSLFSGIQGSQFLGLPIPAYDVEARLGGLILPFDIGVKAGFIPQGSNISTLLPPNMSVDFHLYGVQVRFPLTKETWIVPNVSVGVALNHFDGMFSLATSTPIDIGNVTTPDNVTHTISLSAPVLNFGWNSNSLDASFQIGKTILWLVTPYIGAGVSYGLSNAGGGVSSQLEFDGQPITQSQIDQLQQYYGTNLSVTQTGFQVSSPANGWSARVFGGVSANILFLKIDATAMYNVFTQKLGATIGTRIQF